MDPTPLRPGMHGPVVRELQDRLTQAGFTTEADGTYAGATERAVRTFQDARGLLVDGICGPETWGALVESSYRLGDRLLYLRRPMLRGDDVAELQRQLNGLGFDAGREDGILGPETEAALRQFQRDAGLVTDATCGPETVATLLRLGSLVRRLGRARARTRGVAPRPPPARGPRLLRGRRPRPRGARGRGRAPAARARRGGRARHLRIGGRASSRPKPTSSAPTCSSRSEPARHRVPAARTSRTSSSGPRAGFAVATQLTAVLASVLPDVEPPVGRTYQMLRETRMAAVVCELYSRDDPAGATRLTTLVPRLADAIVEGVRRGVETPLDVTP